MFTVGAKVLGHAVGARLVRVLGRAAVTFAFLGAIGSLDVVRANVVITEIMYNPNSTEPFDSNLNMVEWVEIYNAGTAPVDISGWYLRDEDGWTGGLPAGSMLAPNEAAVINNQLQSTAGFQAAWGSGFQVFGVATWGLPGLVGLSNAPSPTNEILTLRDASGLVVDVVNYDDDPPWPSDVPDGPSIYLLPLLTCTIATANDDGANWARSTVGVDLGRANVHAGAFNGNDVGSPGSVVVVSDPVVVLQYLIAQVEALAIPQVGGLNAKLSEALKALERGNSTVATNKLGDFIDQINGLVGAGALSASEVEPLLCLANDVLALLAPAPEKPLAAEEHSWGVVKSLFR